MRFPVFARRSTPAVDAPILRKSYRYVCDQVDAGRADWIDPLDHAKGIVCRDRLFFGEKIERILDATPAEVEKLTHGKLRSALPPAEIGNCKFVGPGMETNSTFSRAIVTNVLLASQSWDWTMEPATA